MPRILLPWYNKVLGRRRRRGGCGWKEVNFREEMEQGLPQSVMMPVAFPLLLWQKKKLSFIFVLIFHLGMNILWFMKPLNIADSRKRTWIG